VDFELTDEQRMLQEMLTNFVAERYAFERRQAALESGDGFDREVWRQLAQLGVLGVGIDEADAGIGGDGVDRMIVMEAFGRGLLLEPYLATVVLGAGVLRLAGSPAQRAGRMPAIVGGEHLLALAHQEPGGPRHTVSTLATEAEPSGPGWRVTGRKTAVIAGAAADELIVSARSPGGISLFLVDPARPGVTRTRRTGYDGIALADVELEQIELPADALIGEEGKGEPILVRLFEEANAALCAEAVGVMADLLDMTVEYLKTRTQFGVAIGSFQALQHRAVDMLVQVELARSMAILAALSLRSSGSERALNIAAAKAKIGQAGRFVGQQSVQLHGAIGLTEEYKVGHGFKRLTAIDALFGDADHHLDAIARAGGLVPIS
jgi:alkylation response protein AidB-like acyl-CoA dehydrogenase